MMTAIDRVVTWLMPLLFLALVACDYAECREQKIVRDQCIQRGVPQECLP